MIMQSQNGVKSESLQNSGKKKSAEDPARRHVF